jgi:hypothetical protein
LKEKLAEPQNMAGHGIKEKFHVQIRYWTLAVHPEGSCFTHWSSLKICAE